MSPDPLAGGVGNPQSLNCYAYVLNNPETFIDPTGMGCPNGEVIVGNENGDPVCGSANPIDSPSNGCWNLTLDGVYEGISCGPGVVEVKGDGTYGGGGGGGTGGKTQTQSPQCAALEQRASQVGLTLSQMLLASGIGAGVLSALTGVSFVGEFFTAGSDTPFTGALGGAALVPYGAHEATGSLAAELNSFAAGNAGPLEHFGFSQLEDAGLDLFASGIAPVAEFGADIAGIAQQAQDLANAEKGVCQQ